MNRRNFIKGLMAAPAVLAFPVLAKANVQDGSVSSWEHVAEVGRMMDAADISNNALEVIGSKGNNFDPDITKKMAKAFLEKFEESRIKG